MKAQMKDFKEKMEGQYTGSQPNFQQPETKPKVSKEDYIDFEEIK